MPDNEKTNVNIKVDTEVHEQFSNLAGLLNPGKKRVDARNLLLEEVMKERVERAVGIQ